jgi:phage recombination protein Bet
MEKSIVKVTESAAIELTPKTIKAYINQYATDQEIALFLNQCAMFQLNPFKREIYLIKYSTKDPATFVVGYEVYLKRAERSDKWNGLESGTIVEGENLKAWAKVYRKDWTAPLYHEVYLDEYIQYKDEWQDGAKTGKKVPTKFWASKPKTMLKKVAISQAFRMAFPDEFAGMPYTAEEMPVDHAKLPVAEIVVDAKPTIGADKYVHGAKAGASTIDDLPGGENEPEISDDLKKLAGLRDELVGIMAQCEESDIEIPQKEWDRVHVLKEETEYKKAIVYFRAKLTKKTTKKDGELF